MAEDNLSENARRELEHGRELRAESYRQFAERTKGRPTPTQDENDRAALGESFLGREHEPDGSDPDPNEEMRQRHLEARPGGGYQTRQSRPAPMHQPKPPST